jgi:Bacterial Ig-like domain
MRRLLALALVVAGVITGGTALAYLSSHGTGSASATVGKIDPATNVVAKAGNGSTSSGPSPVTITWDAPSADVTPTGYKVVRDDGSTQVVVSCSASPCTDTNVPDGTYTYHVQSLLGTSWTSAAADSNALTIQNDIAPPTTTIDFPTDGGAYNAAGFANQCTSGTVTGICGTASDSSGVADVEVAIENSLGDYWNGSGFVTNGSPIFNTAGGTTAWSFVFTPPSDDTFTVLVQATDGFGNTTPAGTETAASFTYDTVAPSPTLTDVNGSSVSFPFLTNQTATTIGGACGTATGDGSSVNWSVTGDASDSGSATCAAGSWTATLSRGLSADGSYTVSASQSDAADNTGTTGNESITVDETAPSLALTKVDGISQSFPYYTNGTVTTIGGTCGSASGDNPTVTWSITGGATESSSTSCSSGTWSATLTAALSAAGNYVVSATQDDEAGNTGSSGNQSIIIDTAAPTLAIASPTNNGYTNSQTPTISGTAGTQAADSTHSADSSTVTVKIYAGSTTGATLQETLTAGVSAGGSWSVPATTLPANGQYTVQATQTDGAGNTGTSGANTFVIDTVAPAPAVTGPTDGATGVSTTPTLSGTAGTQAADATHSADASTVTVKVYQGAGTGGTLVQTFSGVIVDGSGAWSLNVTTALGSGIQYTAEVTQTDGAGNSGSGAGTFTTKGASLTCTLSATGDTYIRQTDPTHGSATTMVTNQNGGASHQDNALVQFGILSSTCQEGGTLPTNAAVSSATLTLTATSATGRTVGAAPAGSSWSESTLTWATATGAEQNPTGTNTAAISSAAVSWNVTADVQSILSGATDGGWVLWDTGNGNQPTNFDTKEASSGHPKLVIVYTDPPAAPTTEGLSSTREIAFFAVLGGSVLGLIALLTMPIPRRRGRRRKAT